jgi:hypothetical protein
MGGCVLPRWPSNRKIWNGKSKLQTVNRNREPNVCLPGARFMARNTVAWGHSFFVIDAKLMALSRCARRSGICTISYCVPGY